MKPSEVVKAKLAGPQRAADVEAEIPEDQRVRAEAARAARARVARRKALIEATGAEPTRENAAELERRVARTAQDSMKPVGKRKPERLIADVLRDRDNGLSDAKRLTLANLFADALAADDPKFNADAFRRAVMS